ncbi:TlyA family RNA methyltransferase [Galbitalea soli]|uniref:TlyA family RNA methyltransferase n=1 Tax=Galbitalea soli TaxID=1268042 RepID=A0A7C9PKU1_9MICO|nr:TlyA family RNA methyltransferase [Galbitalea soli]NEM89913.1 TlyA family RNA methyltransferase [Galbitalea soli]NYJ30619.1 23S rRNA (cytidine1920-2'-O)/16S rRNA (cytidine1409-2'-O)-methyltransferase [Galbitalea soli]
MPDARLDAALAERGLARSRTHAAKLIDDGLVTVDGQPQVKPSYRVSETQSIEVAASDHYVSRAAHKLIAALDAFRIPITGRLALDVGASTGGFTQVLLERGARRVVALDVGHAQLAPLVRADPRVVVVEGENARYLDEARFAELSGSSDRPDVVVGDLSFIGLPLVIPALRDVAAPDADLVLLIKPQFEVGKGGVREGIVRDAGLRHDAVATVLWAAWDAGLGTAGLIDSPIAGNAGNREYLVWFSARAGSIPAEWRDVFNGLA